MKKLLTISIILILGITMVIFAGCGGGAGKLYGEARPGGAVDVNINDVLGNPGDTRVLVLTGKISELCQHSGCWITLQDKTGMIRVEFANFALPKDKIGASVVTWGSPIKTENGDVKFSAIGIEVK